MSTVLSTTRTHILAPGCHPAIRETTILPAGVAVEIPGAALPYVLGLPGVESRTLNPSPEPPAPEAPYPQE